MHMQMFTDVTSINRGRFILCSQNVAAITLLLTRRLIMLASSFCANY